MKTFQIYKHGGMFHFREKENKKIKYKYFQTTMAAHSAIRRIYNCSPGKYKFEYIELSMWGRLKERMG